MPEPSVYIRTIFRRRSKGKKLPHRVTSLKQLEGERPSELEDYEVNLEGVSALELVIRPDLTHNEALATLVAWRVA